MSKFFIKIDKESIKYCAELLSSPDKIEAIILEASIESVIVEPSPECLEWAKAEVEKIQAKEKADVLESG